MSQTPKRSALGKGFDALISDDFDKSLLLNSSERVEQIPIADLEPNPHQPRQSFDETSLSELASSIKRHGVVQPLVVQPISQGKYALIAGERRWRAAKQAGLNSVPVVIRSAHALEQLEIALIENVQRVDLSPLEQALSIDRLRDQFSLAYEDIAKRLGKATSTVINIVRLLQLPESAKLALADRKISEGHARAILALKDDQKRQDYLLQATLEHGWTVRQAERFVSSVKAGIKQTDKAHARTGSETAATRALSHKLNTPVHLRRTAKGGKLEISFTSDQDLDRILNQF